MELIGLVFVFTVSFWDGAGIARTIFKYIKRTRKGESYPIIDRVIDTLWIDRIVFLFYGKIWDDDPYNFD